MEYFEAIMVRSAPTRYAELIKYWQSIQNIGKKFYWSAVYVYDCHFRQKVGLVKATFSDINADAKVFVTMCDTTAIKAAARLHRYRSYDRLVSNCPFPATGPDGDFAG